MRNRHRHAVEQASRRWRGSRREDSARPCRIFYLFPHRAVRGAGLLGHVARGRQRRRGRPVAGRVDRRDLCGNQSFTTRSSKVYDAFVLNLRVDLHAIDATPARWRGDAGSSPLDGARTAASSPRNDLVKNYRAHPTHWLISTQASSFSSPKWGGHGDPS